MSEYAGLNLAPQHADLLRASAISPDVARERGYQTVTNPNELGIKGFKEWQRLVPALLIPCHDVTGRIGMYTIRPDRPRKGEDGKPKKYGIPKGARLCLDIPPRIRHLLDDPETPLVVTEGARKVDAGVSAGLRCIGVPGVWGWRGTTEAGGKLALPDWEQIALNGREVIICFDSDAMTKPAVHLALVRFKRFLELQRARVRFAYLPEGEVTP
jgi:hypothetical protein